MAFKFSKRSLKKMAKVHPDLVAVAKLAINITAVDFGVTEGHRTLDRQKQLKAAGASRTLKSRHLIQPDGYAHALDVVAYLNGRVNWSWPLYTQIAKAFKTAAKKKKVRITWGGDWKSFRDGPHFQIEVK